MDKHSGKLGAEYSFGGVSTNDVIVRAIKMPHHNAQSGEIIVRLNEGANKNADGFKLTLVRALSLRENSGHQRSIRAKQRLKTASL